MERNKKVLLIAIVISVFTIAFVGAAFAFFNYTRTGSANTIRTGQIYFSFEQDNSISLTNMFPISSTTAENSNLDTITVNIKGNTTYSDGEEFVISIVDVERGINAKNLPITYLATYEPAENKSIGTSSNDYWNDREDKDSNIYLLNETGNVREGKQVLVGYIDNDGTGIEGTLTIKAFIDDSRMVITDTYPTGMIYRPVENLSNEKLEICANFFNEITEEPVSETRDFCSGVSYLDYYAYDSFDWCLKFYDDCFEDGELEFLLENEIIEAFDNGTTSAWVDGKTVFTTSEWNSFQSNPVSFKIKAESNEGIWVEDKDSEEIDSCQGCKYLYYTDVIYSTWNTKGETPSVISSGLSDNYLDIIDATNRDYFLGVKVNNNNQATNIYACGIKNNYPFCIEIDGTGSKFNANNSVIESPNLWGNSCSHSSNKVLCGSLEDNYMYALNRNYYVGVGFYYDDLDCWANSSGVAGCDQYFE